MPHPLALLRSLSILDGLSFLYLLFHSIYSKRILGNEDAIRIPGMVHGLIFCLFAVALYLTWDKLKWSLGRAALVFVCALIPIAPFILEFSLKKEQRRLDEGNA